MGHDERPEEERQEELYAAFKALGGQLAWDELTRLLRFGECRPALVWRVQADIGEGDRQAGEFADGAGAAPDLRALG